MFQPSSIFRVLTGVLMLFALSHTATAAPIIVTSAQYPGPVYSFSAPPNDSILVHGISIYEAYSPHVPGVIPTTNIQVDDQSTNSYCCSFRPTSL